MSAGEYVADIVGRVITLTLVLGGLALMAWGGTLLWSNRDAVAHTLGRLVNDGNGDEAGFVKAMHSETVFSGVTAAELLDGGHKTCGWLRNGSGPEDIVTWLNQRTPMPDVPPALLRHAELDVITNAQIYLCPDTLHNTSVPTPTTVTVTSTAPTPTTRIYPPTMVSGPTCYTTVPPGAEPQYIPPCSQQTYVPPPAPLPRIGSMTCSPWVPNSTDLPPCPAGDGS